MTERINLAMKKWFFCVFLTYSRFICFFFVFGVISPVCFELTVSVQVIA